MIELFKKAQKVKFSKPYTITINDLSKYIISDLENNMQNIIDRKAIYIISTNKLVFNKNEIKNIFKEQKQKHFKEFNTAYHISKINDIHNWDKKNESYILYVGSKEIKLKQRLNPLFSPKINSNFINSFYNLTL